MSSITLPVESLGPTSSQSLDLEERWTTHGKLAFLITISLLFSAIPSFRPTLFGLSVHPYLFGIGLASLHLLRYRDRRDASRGFSGFGVVFLLGLTTSILLGDNLSNGLRILVKWVLSAVSFLVFERLMVSRRDCQLAALGLSLAVVMIAWRGLWLYRLNPTYYMEMLPGIGSRNVFSLWTLAPMTFVLLFLAKKEQTWWKRAALLVGFTSMAVPQVLSLSRSGWVLLVIIVGMVFLTHRSIKVLVFAGLSVYVLILSIEFVGFEERIESRFVDLQQRTSGDDLRQFLVIRGLEVFLDHPLFGASPQDLPYHFKKDTFARKVSSHNLFVDLLAGSGLIGMIPFLLCIRVIIRRWQLGKLHPDIRLAPEIARSFPILLLAIGLRALTANEILFCPSILIGFAIAVGFYSRIGRSTGTDPI